MKNKTPARLIINANPTKNLFISILVRDISIRDAIGDLLDNSVDGALRIRPDGVYEGLFVKIELDTKNKSFVIRDNCGGIDVKIAREYAFQFGRSKNAITLENSVGVFGIGMKRALFRLGRKFSVESVAQNSSFQMSVDVDKWESDPESWNFKFDNVEENLDVPYPDKKRGTIITVTDLHDDVTTLFENTTDVQTLIDELQREHLYSIDQKLKVSVNDYPLKAPELKLLASNDIKTAFWEKLDGKVQVKIFAGIGEKEEHGTNGGWYVFCNKRLVLGPDHTKITGWGTNKPTRIPKYHSQYYHFRGYVFLDAKNPLDLPWNTAKTGMDIDSPVYKSVLQKMIVLMRTVLDFLNQLHDEETAYAKEEVITSPSKDAIKAAKSVSLKNVQDKVEYRFADKFLYPERSKPTQPKPTQVVIRYMVPKSKLDPAQEYFDTDDPAEIGLSTFLYFFDREIKK
jgi:hypothetical protein